jgi:hypothetical protein
MPCVPMNLPEWMEKHREAWEGFCQMRKAMRGVPFTERAMRVTLTQLERLVWDGYDASEVLDQSVQRGWRGVFPVNGREPQRERRASAEPSERAIQVKEQLDAYYAKKAAEKGYLT